MDIMAYTAMIERVARAIAKQSEVECGFLNPTDENWRHFAKRAKVAIKAMRESFED